MFSKNISGFSSSSPKISQKDNEKLQKNTIWLPMFSNLCEKIYEKCFFFRNILAIIAIGFWKNVLLIRMISK